MSSFDKVVVIYNPKSTNDAVKIAKAFAREIADLDPRLTATSHAGHAEQIAFDLAEKYKHPLIVSASGDGGYNEVVNGVMRARSEGLTTDPIVAVLPAGNANDHGRTVQGKFSLAELIHRHSIKRMDLLKLTYTGNMGLIDRYAHSYIGFGISARAGSAINKASKGGLSEILAVVASLNNHRPIKIRRNGIPHKYDSLIFANIPNMAKMLKIGDKLNLTDGLFEVHKITHRSFGRRIMALLHMASPLRQKAAKYSDYRFKLNTKEKVQFDGEVETLMPGTIVKVTSVKQALKTIRK